MHLICHLIAYLDEYSKSRYSFCYRVRAAAYQNYIGLHIQDFIYADNPIMHWLDSLLYYA